MTEQDTEVDHKKISVPKHLGLIIDGNRRWARANNLTTRQGHSKGYQNLQEIAKYAFEIGIEFVSAYIFSTENWNRSQEETGYLMDLALKIAQKDSRELIKNNIKIVRLGGEERVPSKIIKAFDKLEEESKNNTGGTLALCFNYSGQNEIVEAIKKLITKGVNGDEVNAQSISDNLYHSDIPPVDLLIRTSGEQRISGYMLWRIAYAELYFADKHWPEFAKNDLIKAIQNYNKRNRRFGGN